MATPFRLKRSAVADRRPTTTDLQLGELALNTHDGFLYAETTGVGSTVSLLTPWREQYGSPTSIYYNHRVGIGSTNPTVSLDVVGDTIFQSNLDVAGIATLGSGASGQAILQKGGTTKLNTENWGVQVNGTFQAYGDGIFVKTNSSDTSNTLRLRSSAGDRITIQHVTGHNYITAQVGNINLNAPQVSISTNFSVGGISTFIDTVNVNGVIEANSNVNVDGNLDVDGQTNLDDLAVSGISTFSGSIKIQTSDLSKRLLIGDITGSPVNYLGIQQVAGSSIKGFATQYDNASVFENLQGSYHQHLVLGDSTSGNNGTIFGISLTESGTTYERLKLTGVGDLFVTRDLNVTRNLDVDGNTELDDVNVSGTLSVAEDIVHTGDTNTKISFPSATDQISFTTGGSQRVLVGAAGSIGINDATHRTVTIATGNGNSVLIRPNSGATNAQGNSDAVNNLIELRAPFGDNTASQSNAGLRVGMMMTLLNNGSGYGNIDPAKSAAMYAVSEDTSTGYSKVVGLSFYTSAYNQSQSEKLRITGSGNVGIGTTLPKQQLEVFSGTAGRPTFRHTGGFGGLQIAGPQPGSGASLIFTRSYDVVGGGLTAYSIQMAGGTQGLHFISGDPSEISTKTRLFLNSAGSIGINTSNPRQKLHLDNGYMFVRGDSAPQVRMNAAINDTSSTRFTFGLATSANNFFNGAQALDGCVAAPSDGQLLLGVGVAARMYILNSGDITINRTSQLGNTKLSLQCDPAQEGIAVNLNQTSGISTAFAIWNTGGEIFNLAQDTDSTPDLIFKIKNTGESAPVEKVRFASDGKVGIGTDDPDSLLHLYSHNPFIKLEASVGDQWSQLAQIGSNLKIRLRNGSNNGTFAIQGYGGGTPTNFVNVDEDGKVGIGTDNQTQKVQINNGVDDPNIVLLYGADTSTEYAGIGVFQGNATFTGGGIGSNNTGISLRTASGGTEIERVLIESGGNVGIGTDNAITKLHVGGTFSVITQTSLTDQSHTSAARGGNALFVSNNSTVETARFYCSAAGNTKIHIECSSNNGESELHFCDQEDRTTGGADHYDKSSGKIIYEHDNDAFKFDTNRTEKLRIMSSGDVGIGTNNPTGSNALTSNTAVLAVGIVTTNSHFTRDLNVTGVSTFTGQVGFGTHITLEDYGQIQLGEKSGGDFFIGHNPTLYSGVYNTLVSTNGNILLENRDTGGQTRFLYLKSDSVQIRSYTGNESFITATLNQDVKIFYDNSERFATTTYGALLTGGTSGIGTLAGPATFHIDPAAVGDNTGTVVIKGNLQIDGTTTTVNSTTMTVDDKNLVLASGAANDAAASGGGITIESGDGNKTFTFESTGNGFQSSEHFRVASGKVIGFAAHMGTYLSASASGGFVFSIGNNEKVRIRSSGDVNLGANLNVVGVSTFTGKVAISTFATGGELADTHLFVKGGITFSEYTSSGESHLPAITQFSEGGSQDLAIGTRSSGGDLLFFTGNVNSGTANFGTNSNALRLRIRHDGKVLIGTDTEGHANADDLTIATDGDTGITIRSGTTHNGRIYFSDATSGADEYRGSLDYDHNNDSFSIFTNSEFRLRIDSSGRLLLGTETEGHPNADDLTIATSGDTGITIRSGTTHNGRIYFSDATSGAGEVVGSLDYDHNDNKFRIYTNGESRFHIDGSGNVGINSGLTVSGISTFSDTVKIGTGVTALTDGNVSIGGTFEIFESSGIANRNFSQFKLSNFSISQHQNTGSYFIKNSSTGQLLIGGGSGGNGGIGLYNNTLSAKYLRANSEGSVEIFHDNVLRFETSGIGATVYGQLDSTQLNISGVSTFVDNIFIGVGATVGFGSTAYFRDNAKAIFGDDEDLSLYHTGGHSYIQDTGTGNLILDTNGFAIKLTYNDSENMLRAVRNQGVELFWNNSKKFETSGVGVTVYNQLDSTQLNISGVSTFHGINNISGEVNIGDSATGQTTNRLRIGASADIQIYHDSSTTNNHFIAQNGLFYLQNDNLRITALNAAKPFVQGNVDSSVKLFYASNEKISTSGVGVTVYNQLDTTNVYATGITTSVGTFHIRPSGGALSPKISYNDSIADAMIWADNVEARFGGSSDFRIYHDTTGDLNILETHLDREVHIREVDGTNIAKFIPGGSVELYENGTKRLETTDTGVGISSNLTVSGVSTFNGNINLIRPGSSTITGNLRSNYTTFDIIDTTHGAQLRLRGGSPTLIFDRSGTGSAELYFDDNGFKIFQGQPAGAGGSTEVVSITNDGNVGINSTVPTSKLDVDGTSKFSDDVTFQTANGLNIVVDKSDNALEIGKDVKVKLYENLQIYRDNNHGFIDHVGGSALKIRTDILRINDIANDHSMIHADRDSSVKLFFDNTKRLETTNTGVSITDNLNVAGISTFGGSTQNTVSIYHNSGYGLRVQRGSRFLDLNGDWANSGNAALNAANSGIRFYYGASSDGIQFNTGTGDDKVRITGSGNVGINSTAPTSKLDVDGDVKVSGITTSTGVINSQTDIRINNVSVIETALNDAVAMAIALG